MQSKRWEEASREQRKHFPAHAVAERQNEREKKKKKKRKKKKETGKKEKKKNKTGEKQRNNNNWKNKEKEKTGKEMIVTELLTLGGAARVLRHPRLLTPAPWAR